MADNYTPVKGDRVKVTIEGEVTYKYADGDDGFEVNGILFAHADLHDRACNITVEKIEPPVEVFKPGDIVRRKSDGALWQLLGTADNPRGYVRLGSTGEGGSYIVITGGRQSNFTSLEFERVSLDSGS